jgi:hypothetical protein
MQAKQVVTKEQPIAASPFAEQPGKQPHNASEVVALGDSRFLFCDNNISDALFEMRFDAKGGLHGHLVRHTISGVSPDFYDDFESMAVAREGDRDYLILATSFSLKVKDRNARKKNQRGRRSIARESLLRVTTDASRDHQAEIIPGFRTWLINSVPDLGKKWRKSWRRIPDDGGLNVEGLAWNPDSKELLFGLRTPVLKGQPVILRLRVKDMRGTWNLNNFEMLPPVMLQLEPSPDERGIRTMEYDPLNKRVLLVTGNATSGIRVPFELYSWDGNAAGKVQRFPNVHFDPKFRVEGVTPGTIGGRAAIIFVDDRGGYQVLWGDDPRLQIGPRALDNKTDKKTENARNASGR